MPDPPDVVARKAQEIRLVCTDVDGVLTDGGMYYSESGDELKKFNTRDGMAIARLQAAGIEVAIITGEDTALVARRAAKLNVKYLFQGVKDKKRVLAALADRLKLKLSQVAYIGDDINDLGALRASGLSATVSDALESVKSEVCYVCQMTGGSGALREFTELILRSQDETGNVIHQIS